MTTILSRYTYYIVYKTVIVVLYGFLSASDAICLWCSREKEVQRWQKEKW